MENAELRMENLRTLFLSKKLLKRRPVAAIPFKMRGILFL